MLIIIQPGGAGTLASQTLEVTSDQTVIDLGPITVNPDQGMPVTEAGDEGT